VSSTHGRGTAFIIKIPLTLAIVSALIVEVAGQRFAVPQLAIRELVRMRSDAEPRIDHIGQTPVVRLRDAILPVADLGTVLAIREGETNLRRKASLVVMQAGGRAFGILADKILDTEEIVVKPLAARLRHIAMFSGSTIRGDGARSSFWIPRVSRRPLASLPSSAAWFKGRLRPKSRKSASNRWSFSAPETRMPRPWRYLS